MKAGSLLVVILACALFSAALAARSQHKIVDAHMHYGSVPAFVKTALAKMEQVDGIAFQLVQPAGMGGAVPLIRAHLDRFVGFAEIDMDSAHAGVFAQRI